MTTSPGLSYAGYSSPNIGNAVTLTTSGEDDNRAFTAQTAGSVYCSFLVNVAAAKTAGDYFLHFGSSSFHGRVWCKRDASNNLAFGLSKFSTTASYTGFTYALNTTYLVVVKYTFNTGSTTDDVVSLFINPVVGGAEPSPTVTLTETASTDATSLAAIALRQGTATDAPNAVLDGIRVGTTWSDVVASGGSLAGWWPMNQGGTGLFVPDSTANNNANLNGSTGTWVPGVDGNAVSISGGQYAVTGANPASLNATREVTVAAWIKVPAAGTMPVIAKEVYGSGTPITTPGYALDLGSGGQPFFRLDNNTPAPTAGAGRLNGAKSYPTDGRWIHVAATYDGSTMKLYANGVLDVTWNRSIPLPTNTVALAIGAQSTGETGRFFSGSIDDARVYTYALSASEIAALVVHPLNVTIVGTGTVSKSPDQAAYDHATVVTLTATPTGGATFVGWSGDTSTTNNPITVAMNRTRNITATFAVGSHTITVNAGANGTITPPGPIVTVSDGANQTFAIAANPGYHTDDVLVDGGTVGAVTSYTFTNVTTDHTIAATFAADPPSWWPVGAWKATSRMPRATALAPRPLAARARGTALASRVRRRSRWMERASMHSCPTATRST